MTLLRHTTAEVTERRALTVNPAKTCQPIGAMYAALGVHRCLPHSHGSQGCCSYHRSTLTRHYKEPVMAGTSSFTEGSSVFGGQANLLQAIRNIFSVYEPDIIAVHTTCLSETIGDDIPQIVEAARDKGWIPDGKTVVHCNTPSYVGSHVTGFASMVEGFLKYFTGRSEARSDRINVLPGWVEPADYREVRSLCRRMGVEINMLPDTSDVLDAPQTGKHVFYPSGGTRRETIEAMGAARSTIALGRFASGPAATWLENKADVPARVLDIPIGFRATDRFVDTLRSLAGVEVPSELTDERGRVVDMITDMHQYLAGKTVALWGDPDQLVSLTELLVDLDMRPRYIVTGTPGKQFVHRMKAILGDATKETMISQGKCADMFLLHQWIKQEKVDLLIGNTYGKYISRDEDIPLIRHGFPIVDRVGHSYFPTVGYAGAMRMIERILAALMDRQDRDAPEPSFELTM